MLDKSVVSPILVGRVDDLASLDQLLEQAARGAGRVALIAAEAGLGKSRLVTEAVRRAEQRGVQVFRGYCFETDRAFPYAPLIDLLRNHCEARSTSEIARTFQSTAPELVRIFPELKTNFPHLKPAPAIDPERDKRRLFAALEQFLSAQFSPVAIVVIEDLHWADETSLEFLLYLARHSRQTPLLLLLTYRSDEVHPPLEHFLAELDRSRLATELRLTPLAKSETDTMLRAIFELSRPVRSEFLDVLYPLTEGNPFFIEEILKSLIIAGDIFYADGNWDRKPIKELNVPRTIRDAVQRRAHGLSAVARELLSLAAVAGQRFDFSLLKDLAGRGEDELLARLKELIAAQLIVEESAERFAFRHALTREAIYSQLLAREQIALHKRIAEALECSEEQEIENIAHHFYQAQVWPKAMEYAQRAGERALALYAPRAALVHYSHALESGKRLGKLPPAGLLRARGEAYETVGDFEHALADLGAALEISRSEQDHRALWQASIKLGKLWASRDYARTGDYFQQALELARGINDPTLLAHSLNRIGNWHSNLD
ncbi:MAG TPA: AAA family ATPase, partial [Anaerolineae bacterium]